MSIPGEVLLTECGKVVSAAFENGSDTADDGTMVRVRRDLIGDRLMVRNRRPGDRYSPVGLRGHKRVKDLFVDRKVPRADRDRVPIVVDDRGEIVWVGGYGIDDRFRVTDPAQGVVILRIKLLGGRA